jgi:hypothetical protein
MTAVPPVPEQAAEEKPADVFKVTVGAGIRAGLRFQEPTPNDEGDKTIDDVFIDELNAELRFSGKVTEIVGWTANLTVDGRTRASAGIGAPVAFQAQALDLIGQLDFMDEFHVWVGRMLTPSDRSNFSGPWFIMPWNYPGVFDDGYVGPRGTEEVGREVGVTVWGDIGKGKLKYYLAALDLDSNFGDANMATQNPLFSGRLSYAFIGSEPGFYGSSTYYGSQDIVAIGVAGQYQKGYACTAGTWNCPITANDDLSEFNADLLVEFAEDFGTVGAEAAYYHFDGDSIAYDDFFYVLAGYTTKNPVGPGKLNGSLRYQQAMSSPGGVTRSLIEPSVAYLFKDYFAKLQLTYLIGTTTADEAEDYNYQALQLGFQIQQ